MPIIKVISQNHMQKVSVSDLSLFALRGLRDFLCKAYILTTLTLIVLCASAGVSQAQAPPPTPPPRPSDGPYKNSDDSPLTTFEAEIRAKQEIKMAEKDHEENLSRAREIGQIGKELKDFKSNSTLDRDCFKKIERLEKLTKKVRSEAGGEGEELTISPRPTDLPSAIKQISEASEALSKEVQNTPRRVVSASVIANANVLLELIKMARSFVRPQQ